MPEARFVHLVRDGRDVVASIVDRARKHPDRFSGQANPDYAIGLWNEAIRTSAAYLEARHHQVVSYQAFTQDPEGVRRWLYVAFGLNPTEVYPDGPEGSETKIIKTHERWKSNVIDPIEPKPSKFGQIFTASEREDITSRLELKRFYELTKRCEQARGHGG